MDVISKITQIVEPSLESMGYGIVLIKLADGGKRKTLTVMAERKDDQMMSFDDCTEISRTISALLDVDDPITTAYNLEVCSPGIDRPLTKIEDFKRFNGFEAKIETLMPVEGRKRFRGELKGTQKDIITVLMPEGNEVKLPFSHVRIAKLVMTDALIDEHLRKQKKSKA